FETGNVQNLASKLGALLDNSERQMEMAIQNFSAALRMSMPEIIRQYIQTFQLQRHLGLLTRISRLRRLPRWFPMRPRLVRVAAPRLFQNSPTLALRTQQRMDKLLGSYGDREETVFPGIARDDDQKSLSAPSSGNRESHYRH